MSGRVFVVQRPAFFDRQKGGWVNKYDLTPAEKFGKLEYLLRPGNVPRGRLDEAMGVLRERLADFDPEQDYVLAAGDPVAISATVMVASSCGRQDVTVLKYDRQEEDYLPFRIRVGNDG